MVSVTAGYLYKTMTITHPLNIPGPTSTPSPDIKAIIFSLANPPSESLDGQILTMSGEVSWQSRISTESAKILVSQTVRQGEALSTGPDGNVLFIIGNAVQVEMSNDSVIDVIQTLPANILFKQSKGTVMYKRTGIFPVSARVLNLLADTEGSMEISIDNQVVTLNVISGTSTVAYNDRNMINRQIKLSTGSTYVFNNVKKTGVLR